MKALPDLSTRPRRRSGSPPESALLAVCLLLLAFVGHSAWRAAAARDLAVSRLASVRAETARVNAEARQVRQRRRLTREALVAPLLLSLQAPPARVADVLAGQLPAQVRVRSMTLRYEDTLLLDLDVTARDPGAYDRFVEALLSSPRFEDLRPGPETREGEVSSSLSARFVPEAP